jgi:hypothetical protein
MLFMGHSFLMKARPFLTGFFALIFFLMAFFGIWVKSTGALLGFGGMIESIHYCTCSLNELVTLGPPTQGVYSYVPYTTYVYQNGPPYRPTQWTLGSYTTGGVCEELYEECGPYPVQPMGTMTYVGTSL